MKNRRAYFIVGDSRKLDGNNVNENPRSVARLVLIAVIGLVACAFVISMFMIDARHGGLNLWSVIRFAAACFLIAIAVEDAMTKKIHDVLLLGLALVGICALLLSAIGHNVCELFCFDSESALFHFGFTEPGWCMIGGDARIVGALCVSLPMLAITLIWSGSFGSGDIFMCIGAGLILGPALTLSSVAIAMVMAGVLSATLLLFGILKRTDSIPFGPFLSIGFLLLLY